MGGLFVLTTLLLPTAPAWLLVAAVLDGLTGRTLTRAGAFFLWYLVHSVVGVVATVVFWLWRGVQPSVGRARYMAWHHRLQHWWAGRLFQGLSALFRLSLEVKGALGSTAGPVVVLPRHVSTADTILPMVALAIPHALDVRYILKRELLWDPCLDIVGQRLPNAFVRRGGIDSEGDRRRVHALTQNLDDRACIVLYPEGTRFTPARRQRILDRLAAKDDQERLDRARALEHLLPMRTGGLFTLLDAVPQIDLVFMAHTGLEGITRMSTLVDGTLLGRSLLVALHVVAAGDVPTDPGMRLQWMYEQWLAMDRWVADHQPAE